MFILFTSITSYVNLTNDKSLKQVDANKAFTEGADVVISVFWGLKISFLLGGAPFAIY